MQVCGLVFTYLRLSIVTQIVMVIVIMMIMYGDDDDGGVVSDCDLPRERCAVMHL